MATKTGYKQNPKQGGNRGNSYPSDPVDVADDSSDDSFYVVVIVVLLAVILFDVDGCGLNSSVGRSA